MNLENVKALADVLSAKGLTAIEVGEGESRIRIERDISGASSMPQAVSSAARASVTTEESLPTPVPVNSVSQNLISEQPADPGSLIEIKSPLVGVYYAAPSPDAETFVSIGSKVKKGDVLCIIEAMKLMNEITAEQDGEIVDICVKNGDIAEYGQILFKMQ